MERELNSLIIYGHAGTGKTSTVAMAMPNALWVVTRKSNLTGYHSFLRQCPEEAAAMNLKPVPPNRILEVPYKEVNPDTGILQSVSTKDYIERVLQSYCKKVASGELDVDGIVFDEFSVFAKRVYEEIRAANSNGFKAIDLFKQWVGEICAVPDATKRPMCLICHAQDPKYDEGATKPKYKGGPAMPIGTVVAEICAMPDAVLHLEVEEDFSGALTRKFLTQAHPHWERKCRLWGTPAEMEPDLRSLLAKAGWEL